MDTTRRTRLERLIGTDETKGLRGDLARAERSKLAGFTTWVDGRSIDDAIATMTACLAKFRSELAGL